MAQLTDLPTEIVLLILHHYQNTRPNQAELWATACVCHQWYGVLFHSFREHYDFLDKRLMRQTWAYLVLPTEVFELINRGSYPILPRGMHSSDEYYMVWANDFKDLRRELWSSSSKVERVDKELHTPPIYKRSPLMSLFFRLFRGVST